MSPPATLLRRRAGQLVRFVLLAAGIPTALVAITYAAGVRWNLTPSVPIGFYRVSDATPSVGELAAVCLNPAALPRDERALLGRGSCPNRTKPLLKCVVAHEGDVVVATGDGLRINGWLTRWSLPHTGRSLAPGAELEPGELWLFAPHDRSWDSRYYGPVRPLTVRRAEPLFGPNPCKELSPRGVVGL